MKYIFNFVLILLILIVISNLFIKTNIIPDDAIRVRVIANSNSNYDQQIKFKVSEVVKSDMFELLQNVKGSSNAKTVIKNNIDDLSIDINKLLIQENYNKKYSINFGKNYFPKKEYKGIIYKEGYYESLVVTLGSGKGKNWWCVLFPPLCLIEAKNSSKIEYTSFVKELIDKYL